MELSNSIEPATNGDKSMSQEGYAVSSPPSEESSNVAWKRQVLDRFLGLKPAIAFGLTLQLSWEAAAAGFQAGLVNGGPAAIVWGMFLVGFGATAISISLGEMASITPTVGAQYRWTASYAPRVMSPNFWGLIQGWLTVFAWMATSAAASFLIAGLIMALIILNNLTYVPERWHATLLTWAVLLIPFAFNIFARKLLAPIEIVGGVMHIIFFVITVVTLCVTAPKSSAEFVFTQGDPGISGWNNAGISFSIGLLTSVFSIQGFDGVLHMSDEVKEAPKKVPQSMVWGTVMNSVVAFAFVVCLLFTIGDIDRVTSSATGYPIIEIYYQATNSKAWTTVLGLMIIVPGLVSLFSILASVSRLSWAFARDGGMPFSHFFAHVHPTLRIPLRSLGLVTAVVVILTLVNIGSTTAFYAILSLSTLTLYVSYMVPVLFFTLRKLSSRRPALGVWNVGRWGLPVNCFALVYGLYMIVFLPWPPMQPVDEENMNYSGPVLGFVLLLSLLDWFVSGRKRFSMVDRPGEWTVEHQREAQEEEQRSEKNE
ncbi:putative amino acid permease [Lineolata rhizophorae]|uniref:Putative amino acid permease n=1 Tax=Lineolata rhizophorae TaxID=578093 RepID=A0A6A6NZD3_9PEZI|nr:putative amino acid permease [Lineolata rhizophorae]